MKRFRIAIVSEHASPLAVMGGVDAGGQNIHVAELSAALARRGHEVRVYTRRDDRDLPDEVQLVGGADTAPDGTGSVTVEHVPAGPTEVVPRDELLPYMGDFGRWLAARWETGDFTPSVVHAHFWMSGLAALTATASSRIPVVVTYHVLGSVKHRFQGDRDTSPPPRQGMERELGLLAEMVIAQSADEVEELGRLGIPRADIQVVPSGVDVEHFTTGGPVAGPPRGDGDPQRILSVGRLVERKGFEDLVAALRALPEAELVIVGGPPAAELDADPEARRLRALAEQLGVADRLTLVGSVSREELPGWYRSADVVACTPWYEPFGLTPLEAMACGVPVVAYDTGGLAESVIDGVTGTLVPPRNVRALALALRAILSDEVRRMSFASAAVDRVRSRYTWERTAAEVERVYAAATGEPLGTGEPSSGDEPGDESSDADEQALTEVS